MFRQHSVVSMKKQIPQIKAVRSERRSAFRTRSGCPAPSHLSSLHATLHPIPLHPIPSRLILHLRPIPSRAAFRSLSLFLPASPYFVPSLPIPLRSVIRPAPSTEIIHRKSRKMRRFFCFFISSPYICPTNKIILFNTYPFITDRTN